jgi:hypothetical protein
MVEKICQLKDTKHRTFSCPVGTFMTMQGGFGDTTLKVRDGVIVEYGDNCVANHDTGTVRCTAPPHDSDKLSMSVTVAADDCGCVNCKTGNITKGVCRAPLADDIYHVGYCAESQDVCPTGTGPLRFVPGRADEVDYSGLAAYNREQLEIVDRIEGHVKALGSGIRRVGGQNNLLQQIQRMRQGINALKTALGATSITSIGRQGPPFAPPGKKGACLTLRPSGQKGSWTDNLPKMLALNPSWVYSWGVPRLDALPQALEFVPMIWGYNSAKINDQMKILKDQESKFLLGFNEPDGVSQSNLDVNTAVDAWPMLESLNIPLISPSCVQMLGPWMESFMEHVDRNGLRVDAIGVHYYGGPNAKVFQEKLKQAHKKYNRPIMITEFAVADWKATTPGENKFSSAAVLKFMMEILPWLESRSWIIGYAWFPFQEDKAVGTSSALFHRDGTLTSLGEFYAMFSGKRSLA